MASGNTHRRCMKGTRQIALEEIDGWSLNPLAPQILWVADVAGAGKSTVAKEMAEKWKQQGCLAGRFFFSRDAEETRTPKLFFTTIAQQGLAHINRDVRAAVAAGIRKLINPVSATFDEQCSNIFVRPLQATQMQVVLVLDALDECEPLTSQQLLQLLLPQLQNLPHLKLLITSRPESHIRAELEETAYQELSLRSDEISNSKDVEFFMKERLKRVPISDIQVAQLIGRAEGLFIWAKTVCDLLDNCRSDKNSLIDRILSESLRQIDSIYRLALDQAIAIDREREDMEAYMNVLSVLVVAYEPLSPNAINMLLRSSESVNIVNDLRSVLECGGEDEVIRFLHPTFREFLLKSEGSGRYHVDLNVAHNLMATRCLYVMGDELEYDICKLYDTGAENYLTPDYLAQKCLEHTSSALQYSCSFWASHIVLRTHTIPFPLLSIIENFFISKLLDWTYMIGIQGSIDKAITMLRRLISGESVRYAHFYM
jgi:hypothetical protein